MDHSQMTLQKLLPRFSQIAVACAAFAPSLVLAQFQGPPRTETPASQPPGMSLSAPAGLSTISLLPGDLFQIQVFNVPSYDFKGRIDEKGFASIPLIGDVQLGGLPISEGENLVERILRDRGLILEPHVILTVIESPNHIATITGEVKTPGPIPIYGDRHLLDVLSSAGGLTPASSPLITVYRRNQVDPIQVQLSADASALSPTNIPILPGDTIVVSRVGVVYVVGAVRTQGAIPLKNTAPLTLTQALSVAGGINFEAALSKAYLVRTTGDRRVEYDFDVSHLLKQRAPDMVLQNDDIIFIPTSEMKAALKGGAASVASSLIAGIGYISYR